MQIAAKTEVQNETGREHLYKVLRVLAQHSILDETKERSFAANAATSDLVQGDKPSLGHMAAHLINAPKWDAWKLLPEAVKSGGTAFAMAHDGNDVYQAHPPPLLSQLLLLCLLTSDVKLDQCTCICVCIYVWVCMVNMTAMTSVRHTLHLSDKNHKKERKAVKVNNINTKKPFLSQLLLIISWASATGPVRHSHVYVAPSAINLNVSK